MAQPLATVLYRRGGSEDPTTGEILAAVKIWSKGSIETYIDAPNLTREEFEEMMEVVNEQVASTLKAFEG